MLYGFYPIVNANNGCWETQIGQEMLKSGSKMFLFKKNKEKIRRKLSFILVKLDQNLIKSGKIRIKIGKNRGKCLKIG